jgi:hypothetical protein
VRHPIAFVAVSAAIAGYLLRSEAERRLKRRRSGRRPRLSRAEKAALRGRLDMGKLMRVMPPVAAAPTRKSLRCSDRRCAHWVIGHDLARTSMPCVMRGCPCTAFIDRSRL